MHAALLMPPLHPILSLYPYNNHHRIIAQFGLLINGKVFSRGKAKAPIDNLKILAAKLIVLLTLYFYRSII
jgi:hypothetical protein